jgi:hypothetical protein
MARVAALARMMRFIMSTWVLLGSPLGIKILLRA